MPQRGTTKSTHRHKVWRGLPEKKLSIRLIPGLGFAAVDETPTNAAWMNKNLD